MLSPPAPSPRVRVRVCSVANDRLLQPGRKSDSRVTPCNRATAQPQAATRRPSDDRVAEDGSCRVRRSLQGGHDRQTEAQAQRDPAKRGGGGMWDQPAGQPMHGSSSSGSSGHLMTIGHSGLAVLSCYHFVILPRETLTHQATQHEAKNPPWRQPQASQRPQEAPRGPIRAQWTPQISPDSANAPTLFGINRRTKTLDADAGGILPQKDHRIKDTGRGLQEGKVKEK